MSYTDPEPEDPLIAIAWPVPWHAHFPGALLAAVMGTLFALHVFRGGMADWGVSAAALREGRVETIGLHMVAHGGLFHIAMNGAGLFAISGALTARLGPPPEAWLRYLALFAACGLAGAALFLAVHPRGEVPMVGASGALYGLLGLLLRLPPEAAPLQPIRSPRMRRAAVALVRENLWLVLMLTVPALLAGRSGGVAWEAHLGGFLFGLLAGPSFLPEAERRGAAAPAPETA